MAKKLLDLGHNIASYGISEKIKHKNHVNAQTLNELFELSGLIIGPIPMSRDNASIFIKNPLRYEYSPCGLPSF